MKKLTLKCVVSACGVLFASTMSANTINVLNPSFETLPAGGLTSTGGCGVVVGCQYSIDVIPGWNNGGYSGQWQPGVLPSFFLNTADLGPTVAYSNGGTISQTVGATVVPGTIYTLNVDFGSRFDYPFNGTADLLINGNQYFSTGSLVSGGWAPFSATYTGSAADAGQPITIELTAFGGQADFDNVQLSDNSPEQFATPEPASLVLLGSAFAGFAFWYRRRAAHSRK